MNEDLRKEKGRYILLFGLAILARLAAGAVTDFDQPDVRDPMAAALNLVAFGFALAFLWRTLRFARQLGLGWGGTILSLVGSVLPLLNLIVVIVLLNKYKKVQNVRFNFLMQDIPA